MMHPAKHQFLPPLSHVEALQKWHHYTDSALGGIGKPIEVLLDNLAAAGATEHFLLLFWKEVKHLCWASTFGHSPWETAAYLAASLEARNLGQPFKCVGDQYVAPFLAAVEKRQQQVMAANGLKPFRVMLFERRGDQVRLAYDCEALDCDHAADLAEAAYPGCEVISCSWFDWNAQSCPAAAA